MRFRITSVILLAMIGLGVSLYLLTVHWGWWQAVCLGVGDCELVNTSRYSEFLGIPVALLGALNYAAIGIMGVCILGGFYDEYVRLAQFFLAVVGIAFSAYLTYIELYVLYEVCPWCVFSAIVITLIAILSGWELRAASAVESNADIGNTA